MNQESKLLTIFTPTYNRAYCLDTAYQSLKKQNKELFEWLIVDDGSNDKTKELVESWIELNEFTIRYIYQDNQGKMAAHNKGVENCTTELFMCLDSDDWLCENAVEELCYEWHKFGNENIAGMVSPKNIITNERKSVNEFFKTDKKYDYFFNLYKDGFSGETAIIFRTSIIKQFPFKLIEKEKFIPEAFVYKQINERYKMLIYNKHFMECEYRNDGYTNNMIKTLRNNPKTTAFYFKDCLNYNNSIKDTIRFTVNYISYSIIAQYNIGIIIKEAHNPLVTSFLFPLGFINKFRILHK